MTRNEAATQTVEPSLPTRTECTGGPAHRWRLEEAAGPTSAGTCKLCGTVKAFKNWIEAADYTVRSEHEFAA